MYEEFCGKALISDNELYTLKIKERVYGALLGFCACMALLFIVAVVFAPVH